MSEILSGWADLEALAVAYLPTVVADVRVSDEVPDDLDAILAGGDRFVRVVRGPGSDDGFTDRPLLDVDTFTPARVDGPNFAEEVRQALHALRGRKVAGTVIDRVATSTGPVWVDYGTPGVHRYVASYRVELRRPR